MLYFQEIKMFNLKKIIFQCVLLSKALNMSEIMTLICVFAFEECSVRYVLISSKW